MKIVKNNEDYYKEFVSLLNEIKKENELSSKKNEEELKQTICKQEDKFETYERDALGCVYDICYSKELYKKIRSMGWLILKYSKIIEIPEYSYDETIEKYDCCYNDWLFTINNLDDCDIDDGIFAIYSIKNMKTDEEIEMYLDVGCRNTGDGVFDKFKQLLSCKSMEEFFNKRYGKYVELSHLLEDKGYTVEVLTNDKKKIIKHENFIIELNIDSSKIYLVLFESIYDEPMFVVTNDKKWDVNSSNETIKKQRAYYLKYNDKEDLDELCRTICLFVNHINGKIGFFTGDEYITNEKIYSFVQLLKHQVNKDAINTYQIIIDYHNIWDCRGYAEESKMPSIATGLEVYSEFEVTFNDAAQWSKGDTALRLGFVIKYDKKENPDEMIMHVYGHKLNNKTGRFEFFSKDAEDKFYDENTYRPNSWDYAKLDIDSVFNGTYDELKEVILIYLKEAASAINVKNCFGTNDVMY